MMKYILIILTLAFSGCSGCTVTMKSGTVIEIFPTPTPNPLYSHERKTGPIPYADEWKSGGVIHEGTFSITRPPLKRREIPRHTHFSSVSYNNDPLSATDWIMTHHIYEASGELIHKWIKSGE